MKPPGIISCDLITAVPGPPVDAAGFEQIKLDRNKSSGEQQPPKPDSGTAPKPNYPHALPEIVIDPLTTPKRVTQRKAGLENNGAGSHAAALMDLFTAPEQANTDDTQGDHEISLMNTRKPLAPPSRSPTAIPSADSSDTPSTLAPPSRSPTTSPPARDTAKNSTERMGVHEMALMSMFAPSPTSSPSDGEAGGAVELKSMQSPPPTLSPSSHSSPLLPSLSPPPLPPKTGKGGMQLH
jgi:hypothetical protein